MSLNNSINFNRNIIYYQRMINRRIQRQRRRIVRRIYRRYAYFNNANTTISQIAQLPLQITNDSFAVQLFNGSPFH
jgi:hypothetical protein